MAERIEWFDVTVAAGTAKSAAVETAIHFNQGVVERLELTIPDGHVGLTGIRFNLAHQPVIPLTAGAFIVGNAEVRSWDLQGYLDNGAWSATCFNTDIYDHTFHLAFLVNENTLTGQQPAALIAPVVLGSGQAQVPVPLAGAVGPAGLPMGG